MSASEDRDLAHFQMLLRRAENGSEEAARELYDTYVKYVLKSVRHRMWRRMRTRFDSQDFVQQVWASFFTGHELPKFNTPAELIAFLSTVAERKVISENRRQNLQKQNLRRESPIDETDTQAGYHPAANDPTPSAWAVRQELYDRVVGRQEPEVREVADMRIQGSTFQEIADSMEIDESTARRFMRRVKRVAVPEPEESE